MEKEAPTRNTVEVQFIPEDEDDWKDWVSTGRPPNHALENSLLDWVDLYGNQYISYSVYCSQLAI